MPHDGFDAPLEGVKVLDLTRLLPGPFCSLLLADMGANVIKIEHPSGGDQLRKNAPFLGGFSAFFASINRNKRSIALDLKHREGLETLYRLVDQADVVLESFRPGAAARLGLDYETLKAINPNIIYCAISGYGQDGPLSQRAGHDLGYLARAGVLDQIGSDGGPPIVPSFQLADVAGGSLYATSAISAALFKVARGGSGAFIDIGMLEGALSFQLPTHSQLNAGRTPLRGQGLLGGGVPCYQIYETRDGRYLSVASLEAKFWRVFVQVIQRPDLLDGALLTGKKGAQVQAEVAATLRGEDFSVWRKRFAAVDACVEPILTPQEVTQDPHVQARGVFFEIQDASMTFPQTATPLLSARGKKESRRPPHLGEHGAEVLIEGGFSINEIQSLQNSGALFIPKEKGIDDQKNNKQGS